jgi:hypothetical protein
MHFRLLRPKASSLTGQSQPAVSRLFSAIGVTSQSPRRRVDQAAFLDLVSSESLRLKGQNQKYQCHLKGNELQLVPEQRRDRMDTEKTKQAANGQDNASLKEKKPIIDQMTDLAAQAAGMLAETAVKAVAKRARKAVAKRTSASVRKAAKTVARAAKAPGKTAKKTAKKTARKVVKQASKKTARKSPSKVAKNKKAKRG